jgi:DNA-directed RNA polymerase specialized sigma24 family protein
MAGHTSGVDSQTIRKLFSAGTLIGFTDRQLLERFLARESDGAEAAFTSLVERHSPMVLRICRKVLGNPDEADDAFQATFLILALEAKSIRGRDSLNSWLCSDLHSLRPAAIRSQAEQFGKRERPAIAGPDRRALPRATNLTSLSGALPNPEEPKRGPFASRSSGTTGTRDDREFIAFTRS